MLKCAWRGSAHAPTIVPEASVPQVVTPTGQDDGYDFSVGFIARRCVGREPLRKLGGGGGSLARCSSALLGLCRWFSGSRPAVLGCEQGHRPWAPLPPPSGGGFLRHLGGWRRPGGDETYPIETMVKVAFLKSFPLKKESEKGYQETGQPLGGKQGCPPTLGIDEEGFSSAGCLCTGSHARRCICKRG